MSIKKIVLTGGPCAGKTTALVCINDFFTRLGYKVFTVPEVPTMITQSGWSYLTDNKAFYYEGEKVILELQLALEDKIQQLAETCKENCLIVCDRGALDISAYISPEMWNELMESCGTNHEQILKRYDGVVHLSSAAEGAEKHYTLVTNANRYEKADEAGLALARSLNTKVLDAWQTHPVVRTIESMDDFDKKMKLVVETIYDIIKPEN